MAPVTRKEFDEQVVEIREMLQEMSSTISGMVLDAVEGAVNDDLPMLQRVIDTDAAVDTLEERVMNRVFQLVVLQAPVSEDARHLMGTLAIVGELEQAGDDAVKLARRATKIRGQFRDDFQAPLGALAESAVQMMADAMNLYVDYNDEAATAIIQADEMIDSGYKRARKQLLQIAEVEVPMSRELYRTIEIFHALEHFADHAVEIAKRLQKFRRQA